MPWDFDEFRIVDSPGVNATGGVQDIAFRFFEKANAILFVHPINSIEYKSFKNLISSTISDRSKETLFLVLTHACLYPNNEVNRLHTEAKQLYGNIIPEDRILVVDSLLQLISNDFKNGKIQEDIEQSSEQKEDIIAKFEKKAQREGTDLRVQIKRYSRFEELFATINNFSMKAPNLQLKEILEKIKNGYKEQERQYNANIELLKTKKQNPQEFERVINHISEKLEDFKLIKNKTIEDIRSSYSGKHSAWQNDIDAIQKKYSKLIRENGISESAGSYFAFSINLTKVDESVGKIRKNMEDAQHSLQGTVTIFLRGLTQKIREVFDEIDREFKEEHKISIPIVDLDAIEQRSKNNAFTEEPQYEERSVDFWDVIGLGIPRIFRDNLIEVGTEKVLDDKKFFEVFTNKCIEKLNGLIYDVGDKSKSVLELYLKDFSEEMDSVIDERQKALIDEKEKKTTNDQIIKEIEDLERKKNFLPKEINRCIELLENIV